MNHLLDANTLIEAKNRYYGMAICLGFWQWLLLKNKGIGVSQHCTGNGGVYKRACAGEKKALLSKAFLNFGARGRLELPQKHHKT